MQLERKDLQVEQNVEQSGKLLPQDVRQILGPRLVCEFGIICVSVAEKPTLSCNSRVRWPQTPIHVMCQ
jgi:hypothetical protein